MAKEMKDLVVGLDIGTAKISVVVGEILSSGELKIAGLGFAPSNGLKRGAVVNIEATVQSIQKALKEAEFMADCKITRVYTGITGSHVKGINSKGIVAIKDREVGPGDVSRVMESATAVSTVNDQHVLLVESQEFIIDGQDVKDPIGMSGVRLEAKVHIVTGAKTAAENILKCVRRCGLEVEHLLLNPIASSLSVLTEDEKDLGVVLVDIGAGTTDIAMYTGGALRQTAVIPIAGDLITSDIAMALRTPTKDAEEIKIENGWAKQLLTDPEAQIEVPGLGDIPVLGNLFKSEARQRKKTNLMVFLRPVVMRDAQASQNFSLDRYDLMRARQQETQPAKNFILGNQAVPVLPSIVVKEPEVLGPVKAGKD